VAGNRRQRAGGSVTGAAPTQEESPASVGPRPHRILFLAVAAISAVLDLYTKHYWFSSTTGTHQQVRPLLGDVLAVRCVMNPGIPWGLLGGSVGVLAIVSVVAVVVILLLFYRWSRSGDPLWVLGLAIILGGAIGNLHDRVLLHGVRDWILLVPELPLVGQWPVFNLADACICVGAGVVFISVWRKDRRRPGAEDG
jgi:signal peptidase II